MSEGMGEIGREIDVVIVEPVESPVPVREPEPVEVPEPVGV